MDPRLLCALWCTAAFLCIKRREVYEMLGTNGVLLLTLLLYAAIIYGVVRLIKYFIRYGIDYYFKKLDARQTEHKE